MKNDSIATKILKILLAVLVTVLAVSALVAVAALFFYGIVLAAVALALILIISPEDLKAFLKALAGRIDGWLARLEGLWASVKEGLDVWGAREMARQNASQAQAADEAPSEPSREISAEEKPAGKA